MRYLKLFFFGACLSCLALQCDPDDKDDEQKPTYYMSEEFKDYVLFPEGSWWVYENQEGETDTVKIIWQEAEIIDSRSFNGNYEGFQHHVYFSINKDTLFGGGGAELKAYNLSPKNTFSYLYFEAKDTGEVFYHTKKEIKYVTNKDSVSLKGNIYNDIKVFKIFDSKYSRQPNRVYWGKNVGIIRKELFDGTVWELKDYHINH